MDVRRFLIVVALTGIATLAAGTAIAGGSSGMEKIGAWDEPAQFFPGKYFEHNAQFYLKNNNHRAALEMFELAGYWAAKITQAKIRGHVTVGSVQPLKVADEARANASSAPLDVPSKTLPSPPESH